MKNSLKKFGIFLVIIGAIFSCKKIDSALKPSIKSSLRQVEGLSSFSGSYVNEPVPNEEMLQWVLDGSGGKVCETEEGIVELPTYNPPVVENGMLHFESLDDIENYQDALDILLTHWHYSDIDYEGTDEEINHLGDEPLDAVDSALGFLSLRSQYELNDYTLDEGWENDDPLYVEDDDYQHVLNRDHEVKIGDDYVKHIGDDVYAKIENNNYSRLLEVRDLKYSSIFLSDVSFHDETAGKDS